MQGGATGLGEGAMATYNGGALEVIMEAGAVGGGYGSRSISSQRGSLAALVLQPGTGSDG